MTFRKAFRLANYSGAIFHVQMDRVVRLLSKKRIWSRLGIQGDAGIKVVGFESENTLTNLGEEVWSKVAGLLSLRLLGQFQSNSKTTIILPDSARIDRPVGGASYDRLFWCRSG